MLNPLSILCFWFGGGGSSPKNNLPYIQARMKLWFQRNQAFEQLQAEFKKMIEDVKDLETAGIESDYILQFWNTPKGYLARIILFDQLPRSIYRATPKAFEYDSLAVKYCLKIVDENLWGHFTAIERLFIVIAIQHAEDPLLQKKGVGLAPRIPEGENEEIQHFIATLKGFPMEHHDVIERFGRFPGRNLVLVSLFICSCLIIDFFLNSCFFIHREENPLQKKQLG
jgi:uncharacterized protein (DUF924 family)